MAAIIAGLRRGGRGQLRAACGTGKTRIAAEAAAGLAPGGVIAVLVPSIALAAQTLAAWSAGCPVDAAFAVCSDATVGTGTQASDLAVPVSTDPETLAKWLANASGRTLAVATYDSAHRLDEALRRAGLEPEVVVCDEAHRTAGRADKTAAAVLNRDFLPGRRLYMTATPRIGTGVRADGELTVTSMDDESVYGPVLYDYPFGRGIREGYLKDYRLMAAAITDAEIRDLLAGDPGLAEDGIPVRMAAAQAALAMAAAGHGLRRCVAFLPRIADARLFAATLPRTLALLPPGRRPAGPVSAGFVHGEMTSRQRDQELHRLRHPPQNGWAVVANARCLGEGVDIPAIDSVLFAAPKESVTDIAQAAGRALRPHGGTSTATIIVPALLSDSDSEPPEPGHGDRWEPVLNVVRALAAHDEALTAELGQARASRAAVAGPPAEQELPARITVQAPPGTVSRTLEALRIRIIDGTAPKWWDGYGHARAYHAGHGNLEVPSGYVTPGGFRLGNWLTWQRTSRSRGRLTGERARLLDALGITWDQAEAAWQRAYAGLRAFNDQHGHFEIPPDQQTADGTGLAQWAHHQRQARRDGTITPGRIALLDQIGFPWDAAEARWMRRYQQLAQAVARYGGPRNLPPGSPEAGWLETQYNTFRKGRLPARKIALLEEAGAQIRPADPWTEGRQALAALKAANGHLRIPDGYKTPGGLKLANWASRQRARWKAGQLTAGQARQLEELGFTPDPDADLWHARYAQARAWKEEHGHLTFPAKHPLRHWLHKQRKHHRDNRLPDDRARLLRDLGALAGPGPENEARP